MSVMDLFLPGMVAQVLACNSSRCAELSHLQALLAWVRTAENNSQVEANRDGDSVVTTSEPKG